MARRPLRQPPARRGLSAGPPLWHAPCRRSACRRSCPTSRPLDQHPSSPPGQLCQTTILAEPGSCPLCTCLTSTQRHFAPRHLSLWLQTLKLCTAGGPVRCALSGGISREVPAGSRRTCIPQPAQVPVAHPPRSDACQPAHHRALVSSRSTRSLRFRPQTLRRPISRLPGSSARRCA